MADARALALLAFALLAGCAHPPLKLYEGPDRPATELATLTVPEEVEVISVNGKDVEGARGLMRKGDAVLQLAPGRYEVLAFYREIWQTGDAHDTLKSDPALFDVDAAAGGQYRIGYDAPRTYEEAQRLAARFSGWVEDRATGTRTPSRDSGLAFRKGLAGTLGSSEALVGAPSRAGGGQGIAPLPPATATPGTLPTSTSLPPVPPDALQAMKDWWAHATPQERQAFRQWIDGRQ